MALDVRIISGGSTYYLVNSSGSPTAGGAATAAATTPYSINVAQWTQNAPRREMIYAGGAPFRIGSSPIYNGFNNVVETVEIGINGNSSDNAIGSIRLLRKILNVALYSAPAILYWKPNGATNPVYFEIYSADVQEVGDWQNPAAGFTQVLCQVTWTRSAFGGLLSTAEQLIDGSGIGVYNIGNSYTGSPDNVIAYSTGSGDLIYDGSPLNITVQPVNYQSSSFSRVFLSSIANRTASTASAATGSTSSTTGVTLFSEAVSVKDIVENGGRKLRMTAWYSALSTNLETRITIQPNKSGYSPATPNLIYTSPWISLTGTSGNCMVDYGGVDMHALIVMSSFAAFSASINIQFRSINGSSGSATLTAIETIDYYTWCAFEGAGTFSAPSAILGAYTYIETTNRVCLPLPSPIAIEINSGISTPEEIMPIRGTAPKYYSGASVYVVWGASVGAKNVLSGMITNATGRVYARHAPLYHTLRGGG